MSWPEMVWRPQDPNADDMGMVPFTPPVKGDVTRGQEAGLPADWQDYDGRIEKVNAWEALDNPLYEAAAGALDINWEDFKADFMNEIGEEDLYVRPEDTSPPGTPINPYTGEPVPDDVNLGAVVSGQFTEDPYDWGITHEGFESYLNDMQEWLLETVEDVASRDGYSGGGPNAKDWGFPEGNIYTILGLDQPPPGPVAIKEEYFTFKDSPDHYDELKPAAEGNPWIDAAVWIADNPEGVVTKEAT
ncbi:MAG: hypothetical protein CL886_09185 [Dehalococcoidia bacterium]|nr:hypothetical protein [Dehalococcoidia bacterium]|tara:strand:+ start:52 stop:786 length:735 start_codon:yes stop_codon:yes gene_type:complete